MANDKKKVNYMVCVNFEKYSEVAVHFACKLVENNGGSLVILHVIEPTDYQTIGSVADTMRADRIEEGEKLLDKLSSKVKKWSNITPSLLVREGLIENEIISVAEEDRSIQMVITGASADSSSNRSKILPPLVSSVGNKLQIPFMIIPGSMTNKKIEELT